MHTKKIENRILLGITGDKEKHWRNKLNELTLLKIDRAALFLETFGQSQRKKIYRSLLDSTIKSIPLCHIKNDMEIGELIFLKERFKTKYFSIHENNFSFLDKWSRFWPKLYLEMNADNFISEKVMVEKIGGFCVDFSHFAMAMAKWTKEFDYIYFRKYKSQFTCNHLNGYDKKRNIDLHRINDLKNFDYLKSLPQFLFSQFIGLEIENSIKEQIVFKDYLVKLLFSKV